MRTPYKSIFTEAKQAGVLYHFTSMDKIKKILLDGSLFSNKGKISVTRDFEGKNVAIIDPEVRIALDGNKISENYVIRPISDSDFDWQRSSRASGRGEREEIILARYLPIKKYLVSIDVLDFGTSEERDLVKEFPIINLVRNWEKYKV